MGTECVGSMDTLTLAVSLLRQVHTNGKREKKDEEQRQIKWLASGSLQLEKEPEHYRCPFIKGTIYIFTSHSWIHFALIKERLSWVMCTSGEKDTREEDGDVHQLRREENILQSSVPGVQLLWPAWALRSSGSQLHTGRRRRGGRLSEASDTITFGPWTVQSCLKTTQTPPALARSRLLPALSVTREGNFKHGRQKQKGDWRKTNSRKWSEVTWLRGAWWHARWDKRSMFKP